MLSASAEPVLTIELFGDAADLGSLCEQFGPHRWPGTTMDLNVLDASFVLTWRGDTATLRALLVALEQYRVMGVLVNARLDSETWAES